MVVLWAFILGYWSAAGVLEAEHPFCLIQVGVPAIRITPSPLEGAPWCVPGALMSLCDLDPRGELVLHPHPGVAFRQGRSQLQE